MKIFKIHIVIALIATTLLQAGCGGCGPLTRYEFDVFAAKLDTVNTPESPNGVTELSGEGNTISFSDLIVDLKLKDYPVGSSIFSILSFSIFNKAYACSPASAPFEIPLRELLITSDSDFNDAYPAGSNLADLFNVEYFYSRYTSDTNNYFMYQISDLLAQGVNEPERLQLRLSEPPNLASTHSFVIDINGKSLPLNKIHFE